MKTKTRDYDQVMKDALARIESAEELKRVFNNDVVKTFLDGMADDFQAVALRWQTESGISIPHEQRTQAAIALSVIKSFKDIGGGCDYSIEQNKKIFEKAKGNKDKQKPTETREA